MLFSGVTCPKSAWMMAEVEPLERTPWSVATPMYFLPWALKRASREHFSPFLPGWEPAPGAGEALGEAPRDGEGTADGAAPPDGEAPPEGDGPRVGEGRAGLLLLLMAAATGVGDTMIVLRVEEMPIGRVTLLLG